MAPCLPEQSLAGPRHPMPNTNWLQQSLANGGAGVGAAPEAPWPGVGVGCSSHMRLVGHLLPAPPSWHFLGPSCVGQVSPAALPFPGGSGGREKSRINKRIGYCDGPTACAAQNSNVLSQGKQNSPGVNANSLQLRRKRVVSPFAG